MIVASVSATTLVAGLASSIFIISRAFDDADGITVRNLDAVFAVDEILTDMQFATSFTERTTTSVEFRVPDRDGDGSKETIRYAWSGTAGDPLTKAYNGSAPVSVLDNVADLNLGYVTRTLRGVEAPIIFVPEVVFEGFEETHLKTASDGISLTVPSGVAADDLLIAVIAVDKNLKSQFQQSVAGWNLAGTDVENSNITLGIWWRLASSSEPSQHSFKFDRSVGAYGWMMHFTGNDSTAPIDAVAFDIGRSKDPTAPSVATSNDDTMILRIGAFDDDSVKDDDAGIADATTITMDSVPAASGGAAYKMQKNAGATGTDKFDLTSREDYVTATLAIKPAEESP
ncbi:MAG: hypothetical protein Aurels2KO_55010 [Aureliella sp.]